MSRQLGIGGFLQNNPFSCDDVFDDRNGKKVCPYCRKWLSPQGFKPHIRFHIEKGHKYVGMQPCYGKAKINERLSTKIKEKLSTTTMQLTSEYLEQQQ